MEVYEIIVVLVVNNCIQFMFPCSVFRRQDLNFIIYGLSVEWEWFRHGYPCGAWTPLPSLRRT